MTGRRAIPFGCTCGKVRGSLAAAGVRTGTHLQCFCADCRAAELYFGQPDPTPGPVAVFQTTPDAIHFDGGQDKLGLMRLGPKGLYRWYATCCYAPLFSTLRSPRLPFVSINVARFDDPAPLGPIIAQGFVPRPGKSPGHEGATIMVWRFFKRLISARLSGRWKQTPFFDTDTGKPVADAEIPSKEERAALYPGQRRVNG